MPQTIRSAFTMELICSALPAPFCSNPVIFPSAEIIAKCEPGLYLGEEATKVRDEIWTRVLAA